MNKRSYYRDILGSVNLYTYCELFGCTIRQFDLIKRIIRIPFRNDPIENIEKTIDLLKMTLKDLEEGHVSFMNPYIEGLYTDRNYLSTSEYLYDNSPMFKDFVDKLNGELPNDLFASVIFIINMFENKSRFEYYYPIVLQHLNKSKLLYETDSN